MWGLTDHRHCCPASLHALCARIDSPHVFDINQAGPRICLGKDSAYLQMKMTTAILLRFFRFGLVPGDAPPQYAMMVVLYIANGVRLRVSPRA